MHSQSCRQRGCGGCFSTPGIGSDVNSIPTRGGRLCPPHNYQHPWIRKPNNSSTVQWICPREGLENTPFNWTKIGQNVPLCSAATNGNSILFKCPLIGDQVLPKEEMRQAIRNFLYAQLDEEPGLTSCLIIHTINKDHERVRFNNFEYFLSDNVFSNKMFVFGN